MLLLPNASLLYLTSGVENPTPHDYPLLTAIRRDGQLETIEQLQSGALRRVCLGSFDGDPSMRPRRLVDFARSELRPLLTQASSNVAPAGGRIAASCSPRDPPRQASEETWSRRPRRRVM